MGGVEHNNHPENEHMSSFSRVVGGGERGGECAGLPLASKTKTYVRFRGYGNGKKNWPENEVTRSFSTMVVAGIVVVPSPGVETKANE